MNNVHVSFERYDVSIGYTCPYCNEKQSLEPQPNDIYWMQEGGWDVRCGKCGGELFLWCPEWIGDES